MKLQDLINQKLQSGELKEKYLAQLTNRILENKKTQVRLLTVMVLSVLAFALLLEAKVSEIALGPIKILDNAIALSIIPTVFAFSYYQYTTVLVDLSKQRNLFEILASSIFKTDRNSILIRKIRPYSFTDSLSFYHSENKSKYLGCLSSIFWIPSVLVLMIFPFLFELYSIIKIYKSFGLDNFLEWLFFLIPILFLILTLFLIIQVAKKDIEELI